MPGESEPFPVTCLRPIVAAGMLAAGLAAAPALAAESAYTDLDTDNCTVLKRYEEGGGIKLECAGYKDIPVYVNDGDARMDVDYGAPNEEFETFGPFSTIGDTIEWRLGENGAPFAAIIRFHLDTGVTGGPEDKSQVLVVSSIGKPGAPGCVVAAVDAASDQANGIARGAAAFAARHQCGSEPPVAIGPGGSMVFSMGRAVPEGQ